MNSLIGKGVQAAANAACQASGAAAANAPPPPPPKVWCIYLRRNPPQTDEDQPPIGACVKLLWKLLLVPFAFITYITGWMIICTIYTIGGCCCPIIGPQFFTLMVTMRMRLLKEKAAGNQSEAAKQVQKDAENAACCATCLVKTAFFILWNMIRPLPLLCDW